MFIIVEKVQKRIRSLGRGDKEKGYNALLIGPLKKAYKEFGQMMRQSIFMLLNLT